MTVTATPWALDGESTDSDVARHALQGILGGAVGSFSGGVSATRGGAHGVCGADDLEVTESDTPGMSVKVAAGIAFVTGTASAAQGPYSFYNDAVEDPVAISAGDPTNDRHDLICAQVRDSDFDASGSKVSRLFVVEGTPSADPEDPTPPDSCLVLARVVVEANESTSILNADITDLRTFAGREEMFRQQAQPPICSLLRTAVSLNDATVATVSFNDEAHVQIDPRDWHTLAASSRITPDIAGWYEIRGCMTLASDTTYTQIAAIPLRNGVTMSATETDLVWTGPTAAASPSINFATRPIEMNGTTDYFEISVFQNSDGAQLVDVALTVALVYRTGF